MKRREKIFFQGVESICESAPAWVKIHMLSFAMKVSGEVKFAEKILELVLQADYSEIGEYNKLSHYWQLSTSVFVDARLRGDKVDILLTQLYSSLFQAFSNVLGVNGRNYIPIEERNKELVFVFSSQVLGQKHAPTKTLLDRCYILQKYFGKKVFIVNTAMQLTTKGAAPFYKLRKAVYHEDLTEESELRFQGESFTFFQCENDMPNLDTILALVNVIREKKPYYLMNIGGSDICADICGLLVPEITVSTVFSKVAMSCGEYQIVDKELNETDLKVLDILGVQSQKVKRTMFTFSFKEQMHRYSRENLGLCATSFVLLVVGWRLDNEVGKEFLEMLQKVVRQQNGIEVIFMGRFDKYEMYLKDYPDLQKKSKNMGVQEDALAVTECCDLYVNPRRSGGGSSVSEALYKGLPAVTLPMGDVSVAVAEKFWVEDYVQMEQEILHYASDKDYYKQMSWQAKLRAEHLMDSKEKFGNIICDLEMELG